MSKDGSRTERVNDCPIVSISCNYSKIWTFVFFPVFQIALIDPGLFREVDDLVRAQTHGKGRLEVLSLKDIKDDEEILE